MLLNIAQVHNLKQQENLMLVKDAQIKKFVLLLLKGLTQVTVLLLFACKAVIWRGPRKNGLIKQFLREVYWGELDFLVVDAPPGTSDEHISIVQFLQATGIDGAVIVTTPQQVSLIDVRK